MRFCIVSDLHCKYQQKVDEQTDTLLLSTKPRIPATQHPIAAFLKTTVKAEVLICPGDLGDRADEQGIASSWYFLQEIKSKIGAKLLITIPGNHDINSKLQLGKKPFDYIKTFNEDFPLPEEIEKNKFWENGYCFIPYEDCIMLLVNTVSDLDNKSTTQQVSLVTGALEKITNEIENIKHYKYKICILHHHPIKHSNLLNWRDNDSIEKGDVLMRLLALHNFNIVIHGHKHQPRIMDYSGIPVFAAGSFSSFANLQGTGIRQMFHILDLSPNSKKGILDSWEYDIVNGWKQNLNAYFPPRIGFGGDLDLDETAKQIGQMFSLNGKKPMFYEDVIRKFENIEYIMPDKLIQLAKILDSYDITTQPEFPLRPNILTEIVK